MEIGLVVPRTVVGGYSTVVRAGRVQRRRVEVRVQHVGGRRRRDRHHGLRLDRGRVLDGRDRCRSLCRGTRRQFSLRPARGQKVPQVRLVPAPGLRRCRLAGAPGLTGAGRSGRGGGGGQRTRQRFRVAEVAV